VTVTVFYQSRRGTQCMRAVGSAEELAWVLKGLRRPAVVRAPGYDEPVGGVAESLGADDRRYRWAWWFDADLFPRVTADTSTV